MLGSSKHRVAAGAAFAAVTAVLVFAGSAGASVPVKSISAGNDFTCAIKTDDTPLCWGNSSDQTTIPGGIGTVKQIDAGGNHACAIKTNGTPVCWGNNDFGQTDMTGLGTVKDISAGPDATCVVKTDGTPVCRGNGGDFAKTTIPASVGTVKQISIAGYHACAIKTDDTPVCWGHTTDEETTIPPGTGTVKQITTGTFFTCAVKTDGTPVCWGNDQSDHTAVPPSAGTVTQIDSGYTHTCAVRTGGTLVCWGEGGQGQTAAPADLGKVKQTSVGGYHSCAIRQDDHFECWGRGNNGQLRPRVPQIFIQDPVPGLVLAQDARRVARYVCSDGSGTGLESCTGPAASGAPIGTRTLGVHVFTVRAVNRGGAEAEKTVRYRVIKRAKINETGPAKVFTRAGKLWVKTGLTATCEDAGPACTGKLSWRSDKPGSTAKSSRITLGAGHSQRLEFPLGKGRSDALRKGRTVRLRIEASLSRAGATAHKQRPVELRL
jgi:hypothetical protein